MTTNQEKTKPNIWNIIFLVLMAIVIGLYIYHRYSIDGKIEHEDWINVSTLMILFGLICTILTEILEGLIMIGKVIYEKWQEEKENKRKVLKMEGKTDLARDIREITKSTEENKLSGAIEKIFESHEINPN